MPVRSSKSVGSSLLVKAQLTQQLTKQGRRAEIKNVKSWTALNERPMNRPYWRMTFRSPLEVSLIALESN